MKLFLKQFSILISGKFKQHPSGGWFCQAVSMSVCLYPSLGIHGSPSIPSCARSEPQHPAPLWQWLRLTLTSTHTPFSGSFCLASHTRVVWPKLKIKHLGLGCGHFSCASAVRGGGRGGEGSAFCTTRIKVRQNCCESRAGATQSTRCARKELFLPENHLKISS